MLNEIPSALGAAAHEVRIALPPLLCASCALYAPSGEVGAGCCKDCHRRFEPTLMFQRVPRWPLAALLALAWIGRSGAFWASRHPCAALAR